MMRNILSISTILVLALVSFSASASELVDCSAQAVNHQIDTWYNQFVAARSEVDGQTSIQAAAEFTERVDGLLASCGLAPGGNGQLNDAQTGMGTFEDPFVVRADTFVGTATIRITGELRPADELFTEEGIMPANVAAGMEFFIVYLEFNCAANAPGGCVMSEDAFRLVGDMGIFYEVTGTQYSEYLPESRNVVAGGNRAGGIPFLVNSADTNFRLIYYPNGDAGTSYAEEFYYFHAQGTNDLVEVYSTSPELLVREGPGSEYTPIGAFRQGQTAIATGRSPDGRWIRVDAPEVSGWVSAEFVTSHDDIGNLTIVEANQ